MSQSPSKPEPGFELEVIVAALPRSGTASISEALKMLFQGPVYHGGTQITMSEEIVIKSWIDILDHAPIRSPADEEFILKGLRSMLDGYAAAVEMPGSLFTEELLTQHPKAKVICPIRDLSRIDGWTA